MYFNRGITNWKSNRSSFVKANPSDSQLRLTLLFSKLIVGCMTKNWSTHSGNKTTVTSIRESLLRRWSLSHKQMCLLKRIDEGQEPATELESYAEMWMVPVIYTRQLQSIFRNVKRAAQYGLFQIADLAKQSSLLTFQTWKFHLWIVWFAGRKLLTKKCSSHAPVTVLRCLMTWFNRT